MRNTQIDLYPPKGPTRLFLKRVEWMWFETVEVCSRAEELYCRMAGARLVLLRPRAKKG